MTGNDRLELEVEVPGTPELVWEAIASGPGITAWFTDAEVEPREGGTIAFDLGSGTESTGVVTAWEPPRRFAYEEPLNEGSRIASEWVVEARSGGTCVVRLVSSLFGSSADWEEELGGMSDGWQAYMHNLRIYLTDFPGEPCAPLVVGGDATGTLDDGGRRSPRRSASRMRRSGISSPPRVARGSPARSSAAPAAAITASCCCASPSPPPAPRSCWCTGTRNSCTRRSGATCSAPTRPPSRRARRRAGERGWTSGSRPAAPALADGDTMAGGAGA
jgi:uncharacterized protein YndB with AHSA1/START domain